MRQKLSPYKIFVGEKGFTLTELVIALSVIMVITTFMITPIQQYIRMKGVNETQMMLREIKIAFTEAYDDCAWSIETHNNTQIDLNGTVILPGDTDGTTNHSLEALIRYASWANFGNDTINRDAWHRPWYVFISKRLVSGDINYHVIAVVSKGYDGVLNSTFDTDTGNFTLNGDDMAVVVSGLGIQKDKYERTSEILEQIMKQYRNYYEAKFLADPGRDVSIDHFASSNKLGGNSPYWDSSATISNTCFLDRTTCQSDLTMAGLASTLGLQRDMLNSAWGQPILVQNDGNPTRSPDTVGPNPPYTAFIIAPLPWGGRMIRTVQPSY